MEEIRLNHREFVLTGITRAQAECQKPNSNDYGVITLINNKSAKEPEKRYAFAIYYKPNYIPVWSERDREIVTARLQKKYDAVRKED